MGKLRNKATDDASSPFVRKPTNLCYKFVPDTSLSLQRETSESILCKVILTFNFGFPRPSHKPVYEMEDTESIR